MLSPREGECDRSISSCQGAYPSEHGGVDPGKLNERTHYNQCLQVKLLSKELELVRTVNERSSCQLGDADSNVRDLQKQLKQKEWELHDQAGMKDARYITGVGFREGEGGIQDCKACRSTKLPKSK